MKYLILVLCPLSMLSQNIKGKVYDDDTTVKGIKVYNISKQTLTYTNANGDFEINASVSNTLLFESLFHHSKSIKLKEIHFDDTAVFQLKKTVNALEEVLIANEKAKPFDAAEHTNDFGLALANDIKNNPHLYTPESAYSGGANLLGLVGMLGELIFKKKHKTKPIEFIEYKHLDSLFKNDNLFTLRLLKEHLKIPQEYAHLYLDYCETKYLNKTLITEQKKLVLLDSMVNFSKEFLRIIDEFETTKDTLFFKN